MSLLIDTDDITTFDGKQVTLEVEPEQNLVDQARTLLVKIDFEFKVAVTGEATNEDQKQRFGFDYANLFVPAITCTKADRFWQITLPEVVGDELGSLSLHLAEQDFRYGEILTLDPQNVVRMTDDGIENFIN